MVVLVTRYLQSIDFKETIARVKFFILYCGIVFVYHDKFCD